MIAWLEVKLEAEIEMIEAIHRIFCEQGFAHIHISKVFKKKKRKWFEIITYLPLDDKTEERKAKIERALGSIQAFDLGEVSGPLYEDLTEQSLAERITENCKLYWITDDIAIIPANSKLEVPPHTITIELTPSQAFGTGLHPSTSLSVQALQKHIKPHVNMLDVGCGSGIISIVAAKLSTSKVTAIDIDTQAVQATQENSKLNGVEDKISVMHYSIADFDIPHSIVVANLAASIQYRYYKEISRAVHNQGTLIISGFETNQTAEICELYKGQGLDKIDEILDNNWTSLVLIKK